MGVIYKITSPSGRMYVGKTKRLKIRIWEYRWRSKKRKSIIHDSIKGYGWENHKLEVIEEVANELLNEREIFWIKELNTFYLDNPDGGMNMTRGGDGNVGSWMHDIERRKRQSERFKGAGGSFYGRHHTEENKKFLSEFMSKRNKEMGIKVPEWGAEKGRQKVIKAVLMYDAEGRFVREFESCTEAGKFIGSKASDVSTSANGKRSHARGYVFRYKTENYPLQIEVELKQQGAKRPVVGVYAGEVVEFDSSAEAAEYYNIPKTTINRAAMYNQGKAIRTGHQFYYKDLLNKQQNRPRIVGPYA